jgi:hypothetical protein
VTAGRPVMLAYFRETFLMTPTEKDRARQLLITFAAREGSHLTRIFMEPLDTRPAAIKALIETARRDGIPAVAITAADSLAVPHRRALAAAGIRVLVAAAPP